VGGEITVEVIGVSVDGPVAGEAMVSTTVVEDAVIGMYVVSMVLVGKADAGMIVISVIVIGSVRSVVGEAVIYTYNKPRIINDTRVVCITAVGINVVGEAVVNVNVALLVGKEVGSNISFCINDSARFGPCYAGSR
jgi:hypothetical protein